jgi:hypothetical protein
MDGCARRNGRANPFPQQRNLSRLRFRAEVGRGLPIWLGAAVRVRPRRRGGEVNQMFGEQKLDAISARSRYDGKIKEDVLGIRGGVRRFHFCS